MILGTSHFAWASSDNAQATELFKNLGYEINFEEPTLLNHPEKKEWLNDYQANHHIVSLHKKGFQTIELLQHHNNDAKQNPALSIGRAIPLFQLSSLDNVSKIGTIYDDFQDLPFTEEVLRDLEHQLCSEIKVVSISADNILALVMVNPGSEEGIKSWIMPVDDIDDYSEILKSFRFKASSSKDGLSSIMAMAQASPFESLNADVVLTKRDTNFTYGTLKLDEPGVNCLALLTGKNSTVFDSLQSRIIRHSGAFELTVNDKDLSITLREVNDGPLLETIVR